MLTDTCKNRLLGFIIADIDRVAIVDNTTVTTNTLISTLTNNAYPTAIAIVWGIVASGSVTTTNKAEDSNPINFSMKLNASPKKAILYTNGSNYPLMVFDLGTPIPSYTTRGSYYLESIGLYFTEV